jgi:hypothetical protein
MHDSFALRRKKKHLSNNPSFFTITNKVNIRPIFRQWRNSANATESEVGTVSKLRQ